jgi:hypothetical protein
MPCVKFIANETPKFKRCAKCTQHLPIKLFYRGSQKTTDGSVYCKECTKANTKSWKAQRTTSDDVGPIEINTCPVCAAQLESSQAMAIHLREQHVVQPGNRRRASKIGKVMGLDVVPCLLCPTIRTRHLDSHLISAHDITPDQYLLQFPHALLQPLRASDLGGGRMAAGKRRQLGRALLDVTGTACSLCETVPEDMDLHMRRKHRTSSQDVHWDYNGANSHLVESILKLRSDDDSYWEWLHTVPRLYFIQAGPPDRPIKIGFSNSIYKRLRAYQTHLPDQIVVLLSYESYEEEEYELHRRFAHLNIRREWFRPDESLLKFIHERTVLKAQK